MGNETPEQPASSESADAANPAREPAFLVSQEPVVGEEHEGHAHKYQAAPVQDVPAAGVEPEFEDLGSLPTTYEEDTLFLVARDPRWLFTYWDFDWSKYPPAEHRYGIPQFFLRITTASGALETEVEIKPEARNWYVPVSTPGHTYVAELGYHDRAKGWQSLVKSEPSTTPSETLAQESAAEFATVPAHLAFESLLNLVAAHMREGETMLEAISRISEEGRDFSVHQGEAPSWTDEQRALLAALVGENIVDRIGMGSAEIDQLLRQQLMDKLHTENASELAASFYHGLAPGESSLFSGVSSWGASWSGQPFGMRAERGFYMHVNAEIIFYGGTHPDATVSVNGQPIKLSPDGTFRYHFRLLDGDYVVPILAQSPDKVEQRAATFYFRRGTEYRGDVGATEQPKELGPLPGRK